MLTIVGCKRNYKASFEKTLMGKPLKIILGQEPGSADSAIDATIANVEYLFSSTLEGSVMKRFNEWPYADSLMPFVDRETLYAQVKDYVQELYDQTYGYFDPTLVPLAEARSKVMPGYQLEDAVIDELMQYCGMDSQVFELREYYNEQGVYEKSFLKKKDPRTRVDLSSFGGAYALDIIRFYLVEHGIDMFRIEWNGMVVNQGYDLEEYRYLVANLPGDLGEQKLNVFNKAVAYMDQEAVKKVLSETVIYPAENTTTNTFVMSGNAATSYAYAQAFSAMGAQEMMMYFEEAPSRDLEVTMIFQKDGGFYAGSTPGIEALWVNTNENAE
jgi:thiamine biosynthesis lipoprotein ApbE